MHRLFFNKIELLLELKIISSIKPKCDDPNAYNVLNAELEGSGLGNDSGMTWEWLWNRFGMALEWLWNGLGIAFEWL